MTGRAHTLLAVGLVGLASMAGGCGDDPAPPAMELKVNASWNRSPTSVGDIGYQVEVEVYLAGRRDSCAPLSPALHITVNDRDATLVVGGQCDMHLTAVVHAVAPDTDTVVKLRDGDKLLGEARFQGLFPGFGATHVVSPADGRVRAGEPLGTVFARDRAGISGGMAVLTDAIRIADEAEPPLPLISHRVTEAGVELWEE